MIKHDGDFELTEMLKKAYSNTLLVYYIIDSGFKLAYGKRKKWINQNS